MGGNKEDDRLAVVLGVHLKLLLIELGHGLDVVHIVDEPVGVGVDRAGLALEIGPEFRAVDVADKVILVAGQKHRGGRFAGAGEGRDDVDLIFEDPLVTSEFVVEYHDSFLLCILVEMSRGPKPTGLFHYCYSI